MADHSEDLLDDDGLEPAFELDLEDEDALLADDYDDTSLRRKVIERHPDEEDFIDIGVEDDIADDIRNESVENGQMRIFENADDSDGEVKERSRFKTERNIAQTPSRPNDPIPETLDAVPVKTIVNPVRVRGIGQNMAARRLGRGLGHFRGRGRGGPHHFQHNYAHQPNFNNFQGGGGGYYPPAHHQQFSSPPPQQHMSPPYHQHPPSPQYQQQPPPVSNPPPPQYYNPPPPTQPPPLIPQQTVAPPTVPHGQKIHVNPHFKNNLGTLWNGINNTWNTQHSAAQPPPASQYQAEWTEPQDYYNQPGGNQQNYNQYQENSYYHQPNSQDQSYYEPSGGVQQYQQHPPPPLPPPAQQVNNWDVNANNSYYQQTGPPGQYAPPPPEQKPLQSYNPPPGPPPLSPLMSQTLLGPPPTGPGHRGPFLGPQRGHHHQLRGGPPMGPPRKMMRMQLNPDFHYQNSGGGQMRMRFNENKSNFPPNRRFVSPTAHVAINKFRPQNAVQHANKAFVNRQLRTEGLKKLKPTPGNIVPIKTEEILPTGSAEDEDDETKAYRQKIEEQKKLREDLLRQKEERRKVAAQQKLQQLEEGLTNSAEPSATAGSAEDPTTTFKTVRIMQSDGTTVLRKLSLAHIGRLKKITPNNPSANQPAKKQEAPASKVVTVENLSASTSYRQLMDMARAAGVVERVTLDAEAKKAIVRFTAVDAAQSFVRRNHRKMVDLSMIQVTMVPDPQLNSLPKE